MRRLIPPRAQSGEYLRKPPPMRFESAGQQLITADSCLAGQVGSDLLAQLAEHGRNPEGPEVQLLGRGPGAAKARRQSIRRRRRCRFESCGGHQLAHTRITLTRGHIVAIGSCTRRIARDHLTVSSTDTYVTGIARGSDR